MKFLPAALIATSLVGVVTMAAGVAVAMDAKDGRPVALEGSADAPPSTVESFNYPKTEADAVFKARGIKLLGGDGHIRYIDCSTPIEPGRIVISSNLDNRNDFCFSVTGASGKLTLELPRVYGVRAYDYKLHLELTVDNTRVSADAPKNEWTGVGKNTDPQKRDHTLVELAASK
ncbi:hypothetical protein [Streptomyces sp. NPDC048111]|uniref:hypothetical protein n=1 Tax=Streptomyces sp. NPDC048111 TaxID=3365500 RepID=UPI003718FD19